MLTFLRKIRKSLIGSGSTHRYAIYAIGEIVLVVIGILIALQINNWNEQRKENQWEVYYLNRLQKDIQRDTSEIRSTLRNSYRKFMIGNCIISHFQEDYLKVLVDRLNDNQRSYVRNAQEAFPKFAEAAIFGQSVGSMAQYRKLDMHFSTYNEIISNGRFEIIRDDVLRENLSAYYQRIGDLGRLENELDHAVKEYMKVLVDKDVPISNRLSLEELKYKLGQDEKYTVALKNVMWTYAYTRTANVMTLKRRSHQLLSDVEEYLKSIE